jgi:hypothetical protein
MTAGSVRYRDLDRASRVLAIHFAFSKSKAKRIFRGPLSLTTSKYTLDVIRTAAIAQRGKMQYCTGFQLCPASALSRLRQSVATHKAKHALFPELMPCRVASNASRVSDGQVKKSPEIRTLASCGHWDLWDALTGDPGPQGLSGTIYGGGTMICNAARQYG